MKEPSLVVLAAGVGSRYGGPKQIDPVGPGGGTLLDYAAYDARRAGFSRIVLVVREGMEARIHEAAGERIAKHLPVVYAIQRHVLSPGFVAPPGRSKPWGTGHAALSAAPAIAGPFAVINADDFYGAGSYRIMAEFLRHTEPAPVPEFALLGFPLSSTLSPDGPVSRGLCTVDASAHLVSIREVLKVERGEGGIRGLDEAGESRVLADTTPVSLNFWGFTPEFLEALADGFERFLETHARSTSAEYFLPAAVQELVGDGRASVRVLFGGGPWGGLTYAGDKPRLAALLESLTSTGEYPKNLWA